MSTTTTPTATAPSDDRADRLTQATYPDVTTTYTLDAVGNRLGELGEDSTGTTVLPRLLHDNRHRLLQVTDLLDPAKDLSYSYDANGNLISRSRNGSVLDLTYDVLDQLVEIQHDARPARIRLPGLAGVEAGSRRPDPLRLTTTRASCSRPTWRATRSPSTSTAPTG